MSLYTPPRTAIPGGCGGRGHRFWPLPFAIICKKSMVTSNSLHYPCKLTSLEEDIFNYPLYREGLALLGYRKGLFHSGVSYIITNHSGGRHFVPCKEVGPFWVQERISSVFIIY